MFYKNRSVEALDKYYGINREKIEQSKLEDCKKIQEAFKNNGLDLALAECREMYEIYSDERWSTGWQSGIEDMSLDEIFDLLLPQFIDIMNDKIERIEALSKQLSDGNYVNLV